MNIEILANIKAELTERYIEPITDSLAALNAELALGVYIDAWAAFSNVNKSAASTYNNVEGGVTKRALADARLAKDKAESEWWDAVSAGGGNPPSSPNLVWRLT